MSATQPEPDEAPRCTLCGRPARWNPVRKVYGMYCGGKSCRTPADLRNAERQRDEVADEIPRCSLCARPSRWNPVHRAWMRYCAGAHCDNRNRLCKTCGDAFIMKTDGAFARYCSEDCQRLGYSSTWSPPAVCAWCKEAKSDRPQHSRAAWPWICAPCLAPVGHLARRLQKHHIPHERARRLIEEPWCEVCGINIVERVARVTGSTMAPRLVVDHDHDCCPGIISCGACVRGLVCGNCNSAAGMVMNDPDVALALAAYLEGGRVKLPKS